MLAFISWLFLTFVYPHLSVWDDEQGASFPQQRWGHLAVWEDEGTKNAGADGACPPSCGNTPVVSTIVHTHKRSWSGYCKGHCLMFYFTAFFLPSRRREITERERREREERENLFRERQRLEMERQKLERERLERERLERERVRIEQVLSLTEHTNIPQWQMETVNYCLINTDAKGHVTLKNVHFYIIFLGTAKRGWTHTTWTWGAAEAAGTTSLWAGKEKPPKKRPWNGARVRFLHFRILPYWFVTLIIRLD